MANINQQPRDENDTQHGEWIYYWNNGQLRYRWNYVHGISHGVHEEYFFNGTLLFRGHYNMGRRIGYLYHINEEKKYYLCLI